MAQADTLAVVQGLPVPHRFVWAKFNRFPHSNWSSYRHQVSTETLGFRASFSRQRKKLLGCCTIILIAIGLYPLDLIQMERRHFYDAESMLECAPL